MLPIQDNVLFGFTYIKSASPARRYADRKIQLSIELKSLPYCDNEKCIRMIAGLIEGTEFPEVTNIVQDRIDKITKVKDKVYRVDITKPYKD